LPRTRFSLFLICPPHSCIHSLSPPGGRRVYSKILTHENCSWSPPPFFSIFLSFLFSPYFISGVPPYLHLVTPFMSKSLLPFGQNIADGPLSHYTSAPPPFPFAPWTLLVFFCIHASSQFFRVFEGAVDLYFLAGSPFFFSPLFSFPNLCFGHVALSPFLFRFYF